MTAPGRKLQLALAFSLGLNVAFIGVWAGKTLPARASRVQPAPAADGDARIWCPLHRQLGVDSAQWRQIEPRLRRFQEEVAARRTAIAESRAQMLEMLASEHPDTREVQAKQEEILARQGQIQALVVSHLLAEKQLLSPEQRSKLFQMMEGCSQCPQSGATLHGAGPPACGGSTGSDVGS